MNRIFELVLFNESVDPVHKLMIHTHGLDHQCLKALKMFPFVFPRRKKVKLNKLRAEGFFVLCLLLFTAKRSHLSPPHKTARYCRMSNNVQHPLPIAHPKLYTLCSILHTPLYPIISTLYSILHAPYSMLHTLYPKLYTPSSIPHAPYSIPHTLYSISHTLNSILHTP